VLVGVDRLAAVLLAVPTITAAAVVVMATTHFAREIACSDRDNQGEHKDSAASGAKSRSGGSERSESVSQPEVESESDSE